MAHCPAEDGYQMVMRMWILVVHYSFVLKEVFPQYSYHMQTDSQFL